MAKEDQRQQENDKLRKEFAKHANAFHQWLTETRYHFYHPCFQYRKDMCTDSNAENFVELWLTGEGEI